MLRAVDGHLEDRSRSLDAILDWGCEERLLEEQLDARFDENTAFVGSADIGLWVLYIELELVELLHACSLLLSDPNHLATKFVLDESDEGRWIVAV